MNEHSKEKLFPAMPANLKVRFHNERLETNTGRMLGFAVYIVALQILLNILNIISPQLTGEGMEIPIMNYILLSLVTLAIGISYVVIFLLIRRGRLKNVKARQFFVTSLIVIYAVIQMTFSTLNILTIQGVGSLICLVLLIGLVPILHPIASTITILISFAYTLVLMRATQNIVDVEGLSSWDNFAQTDMRANLIIIVGLSIFISWVVYSLYTRNFLKKANLETANERLEEAVKERTRELEEQTTAAQTASKVKSRFLSGMNHELRTPLNAIVGMARIAKDTGDKAKADEALTEIEEQSARLLAILNDMSEVMADERNLIPEDQVSVPDLKGKHILVVDDVEINRTVLAGLIECTEAQVDEAEDGTRAIDLFEKSPEGYYDFIFMDIMMPKMDGNEATRRIRALNRSDAAVPIVAISANALKTDVENALAAGMNRHIAKPVDFQLIMEALREYIQY
ncbi:hypothetical protein AGMMS49983_18690 [Clostridia bacterium]|nr:hypothetical protein AGMMS49983_18690 [Clostridia bacterium]